MSKAQILIKNGNKWFEFSKSKTGQIDYEGLWNCDNLPDVEGYQEIASSTYFSPSWYIYLQDDLNNSSKVYVSPETDISDSELFSYLTHIGPLLAAVEAKDSLLAGELYLRRKTTFDAFAPLTQFILEPVCVEVLFSLAYGKMNNVDPESIPLIFNPATKKLEFDSSMETLDQAFMRYFKNNQVTLTVETVGTSFHEWDCYTETLKDLSSFLNPEDLNGTAEKVRNAMHQFYSGLETAVQAEPYNPIDKNAIAILIEDIDAKLTRNPGLEKAGYVRALAAKVIRQSKPGKLSYNGKLVRICTRHIVVQISI